MPPETTREPVVSYSLQTQTAAKRCRRRSRLRWILVVLLIANVPSPVLLALRARAHDALFVASRCRSLPGSSASGCIPAANHRRSGGVAIESATCLGQTSANMCAARVRSVVRRRRISRMRSGSPSARSDLSRLATRGSMTRRQSPVSSLRSAGSTAPSTGSLTACLPRSGSTRCSLASWTRGLVSRLISGGCLPRLPASLSESMENAIIRLIEMTRTTDKSCLRIARELVGS